MRIQMQNCGVGVSRDRSARICTGYCNKRWRYDGNAIRQPQSTKSCRDWNCMDSRWYQFCTWHCFWVWVSRLHEQELLHAIIFASACIFLHRGALLLEHLLYCVLIAYMYQCTMSTKLLNKISALHRITAWAMSIIMNWQHSFSALHMQTTVGSPHSHANFSPLRSKAQSAGETILYFTFNAIASFSSLRRREYLNFFGDQYFFDFWSFSLDTYFVRSLAHIVHSKILEIGKA